MSGIILVAIAIGLVASAQPSLARAADSLERAASAGDAARVKALLEGGADPDDGGSDGLTALHEAAGNGRLEIVKILVEAGADVDQSEFDGDTALINASAMGYPEIVEYLLEHGADATVESSHGVLAIEHARRGSHNKVVAILKDAARRPNRSTANSPVAPQYPVQPIPFPSVLKKKTYKPGYGRRIAAVIGINDYFHWPTLTGARPDAERVAAKLADMGFDLVLELYDRDATRPAILGLLGARLQEATHEGDLVVIFFAGHGQTETLIGNIKRGYIIPVDAAVESVFSTAIPMQTLRDLSNRLPAKHVYYAMDSCYSGLGFTRGISPVKLNDSEYIKKVTSLRSVQMVTAGGEGEEAIERNGQGVFTSFFLGALDGEADVNGDGFVTASEIGTYVTPRVTNDTNGSQSPQSGRLEGEGEIVFKLSK